MPGLLRRLMSGLGWLPQPERVGAAGLAEVDSAWAEAERLRNVLHDARSAVAGIECATSTLRAHGASLPADSRSELEEAVAAELVRLRHLLAPAGALDLGPAARLVQLDDVLGPLVVAHRGRGQHVEWRASGLDALVDRHVVATVVANLLDNALVHAPGATVTVEARWPEPGRTVGEAEPSRVVAGGGGSDARVSGRGAGGGSGDAGEAEAGGGGRRAGGGGGARGGAEAGGRGQGGAAGQVEVVVRDSGLGFRRAGTTDDLFAVGARGSALAAGEGRGLAHARQVAREHGGEVSLVLSDDSGTVFRLRLPAMVGGGLPTAPVDLDTPSGRAAGTGQ